VHRLAFEVHLYSTVEGIPQLPGGMLTVCMLEYPLCGWSLLMQESQQVLKGTEDSCLAEERSWGR